MSQANLYEVFTSIQGEGLFVGRTQLFVRFTGCNLRCTYCDTETALSPQTFAFFEKEPFLSNFVKIKNPVSVSKLVSFIKKTLNKLPSIHSITFTGGEPLLYGDYIKEVLIELDNEKPIHLETNGTMPECLEHLIGYVNFVSMDFKPEFFHKKHFVEKQLKFLKISSQKDCQVKVVVTSSLKEKDFEKVINLVHLVNNDIPLILQPNTKEMGFITEKILKCYKVAVRKLSNVLIIPQVHTFLGLK